MTYSGSSADLPARVVSPYYSEAARFPAPEGTEVGRMLFEGGVPPMRVLPGGYSVVVTCGQPVDGSLADSQLAVRKWAAKSPIWAPVYRCLLAQRPKAE